MKKKATATKELDALKALSVEDLRKELAKAEKEAYLLSVKHQSNELKQPHLIRKARRGIAQMKMILASL